MKPTRTLILLVALGWSSMARAADEAMVVPLWPGDAPGSEGQSAPEKVRLTPEGEHVVSSVHHPSLTVCLPPAGQATGAGLVILPGGAHRELWMDHEGYNVAHWMAAHGIAGFIVKYRLAREEGSPYKVAVHELADAQRAIRLVRSRAMEWGVDPARVGLIGFSAGGELAALASMHSGDPLGPNPDAIDRRDARPAFQVLVYPGSPENILPSRDSPPAFLVCGAEDRPDISDGLARAYLLFKRVGVPVELHIYSGAGHGFGLREKNHFPAGAWPERLREWLADRGVLGGAH